MSDPRRSTTIRHQKLKEQAKGATGPALKAVQQQVIAKVDAQGPLKA